MPSLLACCFVSNARMRTIDIQRWSGASIPTSRRSLRCAGPRMRSAAWSDRLLDGDGATSICSAAERGLEASGCVPLRPRSRPLQLSLLARGHDPDASSAITSSIGAVAAGGLRQHRRQEALEERCHLMAQRMSMLYGLNSPEFFDKSLFRQLHRPAAPAECDRGPAEDGTLEFGDPLLGVAADAQLVLVRTVAA